MGYYKNRELEQTGPVITNWDSFRCCQFAEKGWVSPKNIEYNKPTYEKGDFLRVWCGHDGTWCSIEAGPDYCVIKQDHDDMD